jgi:hypothetical protein
MIPLARSAPLLVAFYLLTSAAPVYAECAWVLWFTNMLGAGSSSVLPLDGYPTRGECTRAAETIGKATVEEVLRKNPRGVAYATRLPDTVDPRGPKGK